MNNNKKLIENVLSLFIVQGSNYILPLITFPYLVRTLGSENYGLLIFVTAFMQYIVIITDYGFNMTATRQIALNRDNKDNIEKIFNSVMSIKIILMVICFVIFMIFLYLIPSSTKSANVYLISYLIVIGNVLFPIWLFQGLEEMKYITILNILAKSISTILIFIFVRNQSNIFIAIFLQSLNYLIPGILALIIVKIKYSFKFRLIFDIHRLKEDLREGSSIFITTLSGNIYGQGAVLITGIIAGPRYAGYYGIGQKIAGALGGLLQPIAQGVFPYLCNIFEQNKSNFYKTKKIIMLSGMIFGFIICLLLYVFTEKVIQFVSGDINNNLILLMNIFAIILFFTILNTLLNPFIVAMNKNTELRNLYIITAGCFIIISIPLTYYFNSNGMAISILLVETFIFVNSLKLTRE